MASTGALCWGQDLVSLTGLRMGSCERLSVAQSNLWDQPSLFLPSIQLLRSPFYVRRGGERGLTQA